MDTERKEKFLALLEPVYPRLSRYALAMTHNREDAKDLVGEAILVALERFDSIRSDDGFPGFLYRIVARTHKRWHRRERLNVGIEEVQLETIVDPRAMPDAAAEMAIVMAALDKLPAKMKETILLFDIGDLSLEEIRNIQGGTLSGVKTRLRRGRDMLKQLLGIDSGENATGKTKQNLLGKNNETNIILMEAIEHYAL
jgi:RNA polymerase sigma-70 factor, ECF subfamily